MCAYKSVHGAFYKMQDISFCGRCVLCVGFIMDLLSVFMGMRYFAPVFEYTCCLLCVADTRRFVRRMGK